MEPRRRGRMGNDALGDARAAQRGGRDLFRDVTLASAFVARWSAGSKVETTGGVFQLRDDEPAAWIGARRYRTTALPGSPQPTRWSLNHASIFAQPSLAASAR